MQWRDIVNLSDGDLINKGVAALGARRKMLKVFEQVRKEMLLQVCLYLVVLDLILAMCDFNWGHSIVLTMKCFFFFFCRAWLFNFKTTTKTRKVESE